MEYGFCCGRDMGSKKKRKRTEDGRRRTIHPRNKYSDNPPNFSLLASLYPSFDPYVFYTRDGRPKIDWTDFNATRELTRVLLLHDHALNWWIPDGQLCPTVPNRSNYIHWIEDLLASNIITNTCGDGDGDVVKGFDIGTGANCIYPLLGASLLGWSFVGSDITNVAVEWAEQNVKNNPHISELIEIRKVDHEHETLYREQSHNCQLGDGVDSDLGEIESVDIDALPSSSLKLHLVPSKSYCGPPVLVGVVKDGEKFDFCMCNPPFFGTMEEAGLNPKTSCGGTPEEMVCTGGEQVFINRIIEDSVQLQQTFQWYTSMIGRKSNLKTLIPMLWKVGVTIVKTTEFVQGHTCRWGLAWSFVPPARKIASSHVAVKNNLSFMLEGLPRQLSAIHVLQSVVSFFSTVGASCKSDAASFRLDISASKDHCDAILKNETRNTNEVGSCQYELDTSNGSTCLNPQSNDLHFCISVFQQIPGTLLVKGSLQPRESPVPGLFSLIFVRLEEVLKNKFCREKASADGSYSNHTR